MTISVSSVPASTRKPGAYLDINTAAARLGLPSSTAKVLLIATMIATGTATAEVPVQVTSAADARSLFGAGSPAALMVASALEQNPYIAELWVCPLDEASGTAAEGTIAFTASGLTAGTLAVKIGRHEVSVGVTATDTATTIGAAVAAAVEADETLPFSAAADTGTVTLTCKAEGTSGNKWVFATEYSGTGLSAVVTQPTTGATDADVQDALDAVLADQYDIIAAEWNDSTSLDAIVAHLDTVSGPMEQRPGVAISGYVGTVSNATTLGGGRNSGRLSIGYLRGTRTHPYEIAAAYAALVASEPDLARPLNNLELVVGVAPDTIANRLTRAEQETCLLNGVAPFLVNNQGEVRLVRAVTTYVEDAEGSDDDTLLDLSTIRVLDYVRVAVRARITSELARVKIADQARTPNTTDPAAIRSLILGVLLQLQNDLGYLERVEDHADRLVVERDALVVTRVNATIPADIVDGLHVFAGEINLILA